MKTLFTASFLVLASLSTASHASAVAECTRLNGSSYVQHCIRIVTSCPVRPSTGDVRACVSLQSNGTSYVFGCLEALCR